MEVGDHRQGSSPHGLSLKRKTPDCGLSSADRLQEASTPSSSFNSTTPEVCCMEASIVIAGPSSAAGTVGSLQRRIRQRTAHTHESLTFAAPAFLAFLEQVRNAKGLQGSGGTIQYHPKDEDDEEDESRIDIDNMSYEELLAIGNVITGFSHEVIMTKMHQHRSLQFCRICQEEYADNDDVGKLDCEHEYQVACIKEWLAQKNWCPICKNTVES